MRRDEVKVMLTGGGTAGSVTPLLAVAEELPSDTQFYFVGTKQGVERTLVPEHMQYKAIPSGKLRRYFSWQNFVDPFIILWACVVAFWVIARYRPHVVLAAGSFVSVPLVWAAWLWNVPAVVHQQDFSVGLANKLMAPFATELTQAFRVSNFKGANTIGNPVRNLTPTTDTIFIDKAVPTVLIFGGGTGAGGMNALVTPNLCEQANVIHITGVGKGLEKEDPNNEPLLQHPRYFQYELLREEMKEALHKADVVVARAGLGTISELAFLGKPAIIIPMPYSHQEENADFISEENAAVILDETRLTAEQFTDRVVTLLNNPTQQKTLSENIQAINPTDAADQLAQIVSSTSRVSLDS